VSGRVYKTREELGRKFEKAESLASSIQQVQVNEAGFSGGKFHGE